VNQIGMVESNPISKLCHCVQFVLELDKYLDTATKENPKIIFKCEFDDFGRKFMRNLVS